MEEVEEPKQKNRGRKKNLYAAIRKQMEFYFSPSNLARDRLTSQLLEDNGCIDLTMFLQYNKIRSLTTNVNDIAKALRHSSYLMVSDDMKVKPVELQQKNNMDECTIYIQQVPSDATHEWLEEQFKIFGTVDYVSIPKYGSTKKCKGFAFVEFSSPEYAQKAIDEYKKCGGYLSMTDMDPKNLCSIATFSKIPEQEENVIRNVEKRKRESEDESEEVPCKKTKEESEKENELEEKSDDKIKKADDEETPEDTKKKKNRNKKKKVKKPKVTAETSGFQILSKLDWKHLRNKYLNAQREKTTVLKKHLKQIKEKESSHKKFEKKFPTKNGISTEKDEKMMAGKEAEKVSIQSQLVPGSIVKVTTSEPVVDRKQFKREVNGMSSEVKYVDLKEGTTTIYVRLKTDEAAKKFCDDSPWQDVEILMGDEESEYWKKIEKDREEKFNAPKPKQRGKDKLFKKAEKVLGKHIVFDDV